MNKYSFFKRHKIGIIGVASASSVILSGCNLGESNSISASASNCNPISNTAQCNIKLTYTANNSNSQLGVNYNPAQYSQFNLSLASCPTPTQNKEQTCNIPVSYVSNGVRVSETLTFSLGSASAGGVVLSGN